MDEITVTTSFARGIDVSHWQALSDWNPDGLSFVIVKASEGLTKDARFWGHVEKARRNGLIVGAYHFNRDDVATPGEQARFFLDTAGDVDLYFLDVEGSHAFNHAQTERFFNAFRKAGGKHIGLYHSESGFFDAGQNYDWVAHWGVDEPGIPWDFHQYRGAPLDLDQFGGTEAELHEFIAKLGADMGLTINLDVTHDTNPYDALVSAKVKADGNRVMFDVASGASQSIPNGLDLGVCSLGNWYDDPNSSGELTRIVAFNYGSPGHQTIMRLSAVESEPVAPAGDCSDEMEQAYQDGADSRNEEVHSLEVQVEMLEATVDGQTVAITELHKALDENAVELTAANAKILEAADELSGDCSVSAYVILTRK